MSITDTRTAVGDPERVPMPIVLTLGCKPNTQRWLTHDNELLEVLVAAFGGSYTRIDLQAEDLPMEFIFPNEADNMGKLLVRHYTRMSARELGDFLIMDEFYQDAWQAVSARIATSLGPAESAQLTEEEIRRICMVIIDEAWLRAGPAVGRILLPNLPRATFFKASDARPVSRRIWHEPSEIINPVMRQIVEETLQQREGNAPRCMTCGIKMRPAGSCYVCEQCGSTSGCT